MSTAQAPTPPCPTFVYDDLPEQSIRLLELCISEKESSQIIFRLKTHHFDEVPDFSALSYVWGQDSEICQVQCINELTLNGALISVTSNLFDALPSLEAASKRPIWIDAVCINQDNRDEKARVVTRMGEIYGEAAEVLIWLGPHGDGSRLAMDVLNWIWFPERRESLQSAICQAHGITTSHLGVLNSMVQSNTAVFVTDRTINRLGLPEIKHPLWLALPALYRRKWFFRVWTFQEAMLAKNATVLCGDCTIPWTAFRQLGQTLMDTQLLWVNQTGVFSPLRTFQNPHENGKWFWEYLRGARDRECCKKEDHVYAILGLAPNSIREQIKVVYSDDPEHYIRVYQTLTIALLRYMPLEIILDGAISADKPAAMPSWCPDWSLKTNTNIIPLRFMYDNHLQALRSWTVDPLSQNILIVHGMQVDGIRNVINEYSWHWPNDVSGIGGPADRMLQWLDRCAALTLQTVGPQGEHTDVYWQTILAYSSLEKVWKFPPEPIRGLAAHRKRLAECRDCIPIADTALSSQELEALGPTLAYLGLLWRGKVFFSTVKGRVGIADRGVEVGDSVCMFFGASKHYILRPLPGDTHSFKSVAYIHGLMTDVGEALGLFDFYGRLTKEKRIFKIR